MLKNLYGRKHTKITQSGLNVLLTMHERYMTGRGGARTHLKFADLDELNLANRILNEIDFSGATLVGANLHGSNLTRASFYCADLRCCDLRNTKMQYTDLRGASFKGARLSYAVLDNADLRTAMMMFVEQDGVSVSGWAGQQDGGHIAVRGGMHGVDFSNCSLKGVSFGNAKLDNVDFSDALLQGASFQGAKLSNVTLRGAILTGVDLKHLDVPPEIIAECVTDATPQSIARSARLKDVLATHQTWVATDGKQGAAAVLDGEDLRPLHKHFTGRALTGLSARNTMAVGIDFSGCQLQGAKFDGADLRDADFSGADLCGASFAGAKLAHARFNKAHLGNLHLLNGGIVAPSLLGTQAVAEQFQVAILDDSLAALGLDAAAEI
jgi:uncharacterized protein YjbI with pentapeptide repeats